MPEQRWQKEIEEILNRLDAKPPSKSSIRRRPPRPGARDRVKQFMGNVAHRLSSISVSHLLLTAIVMILVAYLLRFTSPIVFRYVIIAGVILLITSFAISFWQPRASAQKRWRGRVIELSEPSLLERIRLWWLRTFQRRGRR